MSFKVLLTNPPWVEGGVRAGSRWAFTSSVKERVRRYVPFPFFMAYAASVLEEGGAEVKILDCLATELSTKKFFREVKKLNPDLIVSETSTVSIYNDWKIINTLKEMDFKVAAAGMHVTALPEETFESTGVDYILFGEYEHSLLDLTRNISNPEKVAGIAFRQGKKIKKNEKRKALMDLDQFPYPARHLFPMESYNEPFCAEFPNAQMITSRGCVFKCGFCAFPQLMYGGRFFRSHSPERVVGEMKELMKRYQIKEIYFDDDAISINQRRMKEICKLIQKEKIEMPWCAMTHVSCVSRDLLKEMQASGCEGIKFGLENASQEILNSLGKGINLHHAEKVVNWCKDLGIRTHLTFMFGLPGETKGTINRTMEMAKRLDSKSVQFSIATPFPGTEFYSMAVEKGWITTKEWSKYDGNKYAVISYPDLHGEDLIEALEFARRMYLMKTLTSRRVLGAIKNVYCERGLIKTASLLIKKPPSYISEMLKYAYKKRKYLAR